MMKFSHVHAKREEERKNVPVPVSCCHIRHEKQQRKERSGIRMMTHGMKMK